VKFQNTEYWSQEKHWSILGPQSICQGTPNRVIFTSMSLFQRQLAWLAVGFLHNATLAV